jgi:hypothetical protein
LGSSPSKEETALAVLVYDGLSFIELSAVSAEYKGIGKYGGAK